MELYITVMEGLKSMIVYMTSYLVTNVCSSQWGTDCALDLPVQNLAPDSSQDVFDYQDQRNFRLAFLCIHTLMYTHPLGVCLLCGVILAY